MLLLFRDLSGLEGASSVNSVTNSSRERGIVVLGVFLRKKQQENGLSCCPCHYCHFFLLVDNCGLCKAVLSNFLISRLKKALKFTNLRAY